MKYLVAILCIYIASFSTATAQQLRSIEGNISELSTKNQFLAVLLLLNIERRDSIHIQMKMETSQ